MLRFAHGEERKGEPLYMVGVGAAGVAVCGALLSELVCAGDTDAAGISVFLLVPVCVGGNYVGAFGDCLSAGEAIGEIPPRWFCSQIWQNMGVRLGSRFAPGLVQ